MLIFGHEAAGLHDASKDVDVLIDVFSVCVEQVGKTWSAVTPIIQTPWINAEWRQTTYPCAWLLERYCHRACYTCLRMLLTCRRACRSRAAKSSKEQAQACTAGAAMAGRPKATHADSDSDVDDEHAHAYVAVALPAWQVHHDDRALLMQATSQCNR